MPAPRLAIVLSHPVQYYSPWFRWLQANTPVALRVFYLWDFGVTQRRDPQFGASFRWDIDLLSGYESEFVPNRSHDPGTHHFFGLDNPGLAGRIAQWRPRAILFFGYKWLSHMRAILWARRRGIPLLFRGDSHLLGGARHGLPARTALRILYRQFDAFLAVGAANRDYFRAFGVHESRLFNAPHAVEATRFDPGDAGTLGKAAALRAELGLGDRRVLLFAGKWQERKQPVELLRAFLEVAQDRDAIVYVGDGSERDRLAALARGHPGACVRFLPFANQTEMPVRYALGDVFALPSRGSYETWGLAVNEAMHMGLPCLVSDVVGCQRDLVIPGETGWVFAAGDPHALLGAVDSCLRAPRPELARLGRNARQRVASCSYAAAGRGLVEALGRLAPA